MSQSPTSSAAGSARRAQASTKQKKTRSRNGCPQCKLKRLKCDETRPACLMCTRAGRKCPGYSQEFRWSTKHEKSIETTRIQEPSSFGNLLTAVTKVLSGDGPQASDRKQDAVPQHQRQQQQQQHQKPQKELPLPRSLPLHTNISAPAPATFPELQTPISTCAELDLLPPSTSSGVPLGLATPSSETYIGEEMVPSFACWDAGLVEDPLGDVVLYTDSTQIVANAAPSIRPPFTVQYDFPPLRPSPKEQADFRAPVRAPWIPRSVMDRSSMLVEEWFKHVCTIWSCFDSDLNFNRKIAANAWTRSEAVMRCMQSMAATCLSSQMPQMRQVAIASLKKAISTIKMELRFAGPALARGVFPTDLLLSLCCVGTAACWIDTKQLAAQFLREARIIIDRVNRETYTVLRPEDREALSFFNNSIIYWDMLVAVVADDENEDDSSRLLIRASYSQNSAGQIVPHPWTGTCASAQRLFARAIRLCRRFRRHLRGHSISTEAVLRTALRHITEAQRIEEELLALEQATVDHVAETGDRLTPREHLVDVAEGYRLASLLQLYQTFPDLVVRRLPEDATGEDGVVPWDRWVVPLSLRLVETLRRVPPDSGTRCIQPLLYLSASTGLKFDAETALGGLQPQQQQQQQYQRQQPLQSPQQQFAPAVIAEDTVSGASLSQAAIDGSACTPTSLEADAELDRALSSLEDPEPPAPTADDESINILLQVPLTKLSIEISHARRFIMERLSAMEHNLPPAPVRVAKELVTAVWAAYDSERPGTNLSHWIDVMEELDLRTIFG